MSSSCPSLLLARLSRGLLFLFALLVIAVLPRVQAQDAPEAATVETSPDTFAFDLPADEAPAAFRRFSEISGAELLYASELVKGVRTAPVRGEFTPLVALERMLANTDLKVIIEKESRAFVVKKADPPSAPIAPLPKPQTRPSTNRSEARATDEVIELEAFPVTGSRLHGLLEGATAQPVVTIDSVSIERTGAQSIGEVLGYIPQVSSFTLGQGNTQSTSTTLFSFATGEIIQGASAGNLSAADGRVTATIRGAPPGATLILIDGRRAPKNSQSRSGDGFDLSGIPLAAVDRIEVLLDGASSIYGADAMGGVINVILKKNYSGTELRLGYENTFDTDVGVRTASLSQGFSVGKLRGLFTVSWEDANALALRDRSFLESFDRRPLGGGDFRNSNTPGGAGRISIRGSDPIPGLTVTESAVPPGTTGDSISVADYAAAGPLPEPFDLGQFMEYAATYERTTALAKLDYAFSDWLEFYAEARLGENENRSPGAPIVAEFISIPIGYPGNPFGIPVTLNKWFTDLRPLRVSTNETTSFTVGAAGRLPNRWRYDASVSYASSHLLLDGDTGAKISRPLFAAAVAAGEQPNLFYDSTRVANPNAPGVIEALTEIDRDEEESETWTIALQADGPLFELPAGSVVAAVGVERREEDVDFPLRSDTDTFSALPGSDEVNAWFTELNFPLLSSEQNIPFVEQLNLSGSYRYEDYGEGESSKNPRAGIAWRPVSWILARGSYGEGSKVPTFQQRNAPLRVRDSFLFSSPANRDPLRGDTVNDIYPSTSGGKPDLLPEKSENTSFGLVVEVPVVKGLSFSFDWFDNVFKDRVSTLTFNQMALLFPSRITRGANLPSDPPDWAGPVTAADLRPINVSFSQISGYDIGVRYDRVFEWGDIQVSVTGTKYTRNELIPAPGGLPSPTVTTDSLPVQITGNAFVNRGAWGAGLMGTYRERNRSQPTRTFTSSALRWDVMFSYDFGEAAWNQDTTGIWHSILADTKLSLTIFNLLDRKPPLDSSFFPDNTILDSRMRRYAVSLTRTF